MTPARSTTNEPHLEGICSLHAKRMGRAWSARVTRWGAQSQRTDGHRRCPAATTPASARAVCAPSPLSAERAPLQLRRMRAGAAGASDAHGREGRAGRGVGMGVRRAAVTAVVRAAAARLPTAFPEPAGAQSLLAQNCWRKLCRAIARAGTGRGGAGPAAAHASAVAVR